MFLNVLECSFYITMHFTQVLAIPNAYNLVILLVNFLLFIFYNYCHLEEFI